MVQRFEQDYSTRTTPQTESIPGKNMVENSAGGYAFAVDDWTRLDRFLVLGTEGGTYYVGERALTIDNAEAVRRCIASDGSRTVERITEISVGGRAPKNDAALFALAMCLSFGDPQTKARAGTALRQVARIGTHLFAFCEYVQALRGWGRGLRSAVAAWYDNMEADRLAYQMTKYRQRGGWTHRDVLRLAHPCGHPSLYRWATGKEIGPEESLPDHITAWTNLQAATTAAHVVEAIEKWPALSWEMVPSSFLGENVVWAALLPNLPMTALMRNLGRMSANGLLSPLSDASKTVCTQLDDTDRLRKARVHPIQALSALLTYQSGHGARGNLSWEPVPQVVDALERAFYASFGTVDAAEKRTLLALDVSGSMRWSEIAGVPGLTPSLASTALAMVTARTEPEYHVMGFSDAFRSLGITAGMNLAEALGRTQRQTFGGTDCSLPMQWAAQQRVEVDTFVVYTDNETWAGSIHPCQALTEYRQQMGIDAKLIVVGMTATEFSIADPDDAGMLDVVGFDTATPNLITEFARS